MNRREFIEALAVTSSIAGMPALAGTAEPNRGFPSAARDRLAVASYPFRCT